MALVLAAACASAAAARHPRYPAVPKSKLFGRIAYSTRGGDIGFAPHDAKTCGYRSRDAAMIRSRVGGRSIASLRS